MKQKQLLLISAILCSIGSLSIPSNSFSQKVGYKYMEKHLITNPGPNLSDYQLHLVINGKAYVDSGKMRMDGGDLRFASDPKGKNLLDYWVETSFYPTADVWIRKPLLHSVDSIFMFYGNPDSTSKSNFNATFPYSLIVNNQTILLPYRKIDWLEVGPTGRINIPAEKIMKMNPRKAIIKGVINADGKGFKGGSFDENGFGTGAGKVSVSSPKNGGPGGGGYGNTGGHGGQGSSTGIPGAGGQLYDDAHSPDTSNMGSGGAGGDNQYGGNGGGCVWLKAEFIEISGNISANGVNGMYDSQTLRASAGGAGGGILIQGSYVDISGTLSADGGNGTCISESNEDGGGGSGGRIKIYYDKKYTSSKKYSYSGGIIPCKDTSSGGGGGGLPLLGPEGGSIGTMVEIPFPFNNPTTDTSKSPQDNPPPPPAQEHIGFGYTYTASKQDVQFKDSTNNNPVSWLWDFGDSSSSTSQNPSHSYADQKEYNVCMTVTNNSGKHTLCKNVSTIEKTPPPPTSIQKTTGTHAIHVYPNPVIHTIYMSGSFENNYSELEIYNTMGALVKKAVYGNIENNTIACPVEELPQGMYFIKIKTSNANMISPIVIEKN